MIRDYQKEDYLTLGKWWTAWDFMPVHESMLPDIGVIADEIAAGFLYTTNSKVCWIEWLVTDKSAPVIARSEALDKVLETLCQTAKRLGFTAIFTSSNSQPLVRRLKEFDFIVGDQDVIQLFKTVKG